jgi:nitrogen PTS system EIIA component
MDISDFLAPERVLLDVRARDKAHLMAEIARSFAHQVPSVRADAIEAALLAREQLGSTGLGGGFALPHARIEGLAAYRGMFLRLAKPIAFQAIDGAPVGVVFALLTPEKQEASHVGALAAISRRFRDAALVARLRQARSPVEAYDVLTKC